MIDPDSGRFTYSYRVDHRLDQLVNPWDERTTFGYDNGGRRIVNRLANGTRVSWTYDNADNIIALVNLKSDGTTISSFAYAYDATGNRTHVLEATGDLTTWSYDKTYQLTREHRGGLDAFDLTYTYDRVGNRLLKQDSGAPTTYTYNAANRLLTERGVAGVTTFSYDNNGNRMVEEKPTGDRTTSTWGYDNQVRSIVLLDGSVTTYSYNGAEQRVRREDFGGIVDYVFDYLSILAEHDELGTIQTIYTHQPDEYGTLVSQHREGDSSFYHFDGLGSTAALTDSGEVITDTYTYFAFGDGNQSTGSTDNPFQYVGSQGYYKDSAASMYNLRARDYDPNTGRFVSPDPAEADINLYRYCENNPLIYIDPTGLIPGDPLSLDGSAAALAQAGWTAAEIAMATGLSLAAATAIVYNAEVTKAAESIIKGLTATATAANAGDPCAAARAAVKLAEKSISSFEKLITKHEQKIADPTKYMTHPYSGFSQAQNIAIAIADWNRQIAGFKRSIDTYKIALDALKKAEYAACFSWICPWTWF